MSGHARLSPSGLHRSMRCPGSVREEARYPSEGWDTPASIDGTKTHGILEHCIKNGLMDPMLLIDQEFTVDGHTFTLEPDRAIRVAKAISYIRAQQDCGGPVAIRAEERVDAGKWIGRTDLKGTADVQIIKNDILEVIDYKDGVGEVSPIENEQLLAYAAGVAYEYREEVGAGERARLPFQSIVLTIIQPKLETFGKIPINSWAIDVDQLMAFIEKLDSAAKAADDPDAPLVPGEVQCKWCKHKGACAALADHTLSTAGVSFDAVDSMAQQAADSEATALSDDRIREIVEAEPLITGFLDSVKKEALRRLESGHEIRGLKIVMGRGSRDWVMEGEELEQALRKLGIPKKALYVTKIVSPAQAEKLSWEGTRGASKGQKMKLSPKKLELMEKNMISRKAGKPTVVADSDSRPAVSMGAASAFSDIREQNPSVPDWL